MQRGFVKGPRSSYNVLLYTRMNEHTQTNTSHITSLQNRNGMDGECRERGGPQHSPPPFLTECIPKSYYYYIAGDFCYHYAWAFANVRVRSAVGGSESNLYERQTKHCITTTTMMMRMLARACNVCVFCECAASASSPNSSANNKNNINNNIHADDKCGKTFPSRVGSHHSTRHHRRLRRCRRRPRATTSIIMCLYIYSICFACMFFFAFTVCPPTPIGPQ